MAGLGAEVIPPKGDQLRLVSWNLGNFPRDDQDLTRLRERLLALDADVVAVQEIKQPDALRDLMPEWRLAISEQGGAGHQRVGFLYDPRTIELVGEPAEHRGLTMKGRVRPAFSVYLRRLPSGPDFHAVVVHLKARPDGLDLRRKQWPELAEVVESLGRDDADVVVLGDFNTTGPEDGDRSRELDELDAVLARAGVGRLPNEAGCSAYWDGHRRDAWQEPSLLDLAWTGGLGESVSPATAVTVLGPCARHRCEPFRSTEAYPELDYETVSDHCPIVIDLSAGRDDDP
jgi:endonuclease/exonuclease/phosphatase family metal-dependent hydrolase